MKKLITLIIVLSTFHFNPTNTKAQAYSSDRLYINAGVSLIYNAYRPSNLWYWSNYNYSFTPPLIVSVEKGVSELFSVGVYGTHRSYGWEYTTSAGRYESSHTRMSFGGRVSFHYAELLNEHLDLGIPTDKIDLYLTGIIGINSHKYSRTEPTERWTTNDFKFFIGPVLGARYMFSDNFGLYAEGGRGSLGSANLGITLKL